MYILKNTNLKSKFYGKYCISYNAYDTTYVYYDNGKCVWTNVNGFTRVKLYNRGDTVRYKNKNLQFQYYHGASVHLINEAFQSVCIHPKEFLKYCYKGGVRLL